MTGQALFADWWSKLAEIGLIAFAAVGGLIALFHVVQVQFHGLEASRDALRRNEAALRQNTTVLETTLANMDQGLIMVGADRTVMVCNPCARALFGLLPEKLAAQTRYDDLVAACPDIGASGEASVAEDAGNRPRSVEVRRANGTWLEIRTILLPDGGLVRTYADITDRKTRERDFKHAARHDALTGLVNRTTFTRRLHKAIARAGATSRPVTVMLLDLDRFKVVNDTMGHAAGDELLQQAAWRMQEMVRDGDTLARLGGDEFALILPGVALAETAVAAAERLRRAVGQPYALQAGTARIGVSIGIARHPAHGFIAEDILRHADLALYRAKANGRNGFCEFDAKLDLQSIDTLEAELETALQEGQLYLEYQPIWDIQAERLAAVEALVRWRHPTRGIIAPDSFIPLAERTGLVIPLGRWVMETACRAALTWDGPVKVAVNVAPAQVRRREILAEITTLLATTGLPAERLKLEITESQELEETGEIVATMQALRNLGLRLALDDFGTAHASLSTLRAFPFTDVKIDRSFIQGLLQDDRARGLMEAILQVCQVLSLNCVAEGVETAAQYELIRTLGCTHAQGYLIGRPQSAGQIRRLLADGRRPLPTSVREAAM